MNEAQARGLFFEVVVKKLLESSGYLLVQSGGIKGRGEIHQIDAYGKFHF